MLCVYGQRDKDVEEEKSGWCTAKQDIRTHEAYGTVTLTHTTQTHAFLCLLTDVVHALSVSVSVAHCLTFSL
ncbi:hypothetical protein VNO78_25054 [Psophocarpus tetragonolobus]|uniref:Uncharacterized protein n=1 Tax=Psophocarpus tetragonolobus TaxID=3891 RepID=A0AAN9XF28_PSOTE